MGALGVAAATGKEPADKEPETQPEPEAREDAPAAEPQTHFVPQSKLEGKPSRRNKTAEQVEDRLKTWEEERRKEREEWSKRDRERDETLARLTGTLEALQRQPAPQPVVQQQTAKEDPEELFRQSAKALEANQYEEHKRLERKAYELIADQRAERAAAAVREEVAKNQPRQLDPAIQFMVYQHPHVAARGEEGLALVVNEDQRLGWLKRIPPGPQRIAMAFANINKELAPATTPQQQAPRYSQDAAGALAGVPGESGSGGSGRRKEPGIELTEVEMKAARDAKMSYEEYAQFHPKNIHNVLKNRR